MGEFLQNVRKSLIKGPQQRGFKLSSWEAAFGKILNPDDMDKALFESGKWFATEFGEVRKKTAGHANIAGPEPIEAIVGYITHQWAVIKEKTQQALNGITQDGEFVSEQISELRITNAMGIPFYPEVAIEALVDGARFPLSYEFSKIAPFSSSEVDTLNSISGLLALGQYYHTLEQWWLECIWNDYRVISTEHEIEVLQCPGGTHKIQAVTQYRRDARNREAMMIADSSWKFTLNETTKQEFLSKKQRFSSYKRHEKTRIKVSPVGRNKNAPDASFVSRTMLTHEYLYPLHSKARRQFSGLSIDQLLDAYELVSHLPEQIYCVLPQKDKIESISGLTRFAPKIQISELKAAFKTALSITDKQIDWLIGQLTFDTDVYQQLWFRPFVRLNNDVLSLIAPAVSGTHFVRIVDYFLKQIDDVEKEAGKLFEEYARSEMQKSAESFRFKGKLRVICKSLKFEVSSDEYEEIDLIYLLGNNIYIGELKAMITPAEPLEVFHYIERLKSEGVNQAKRKADFVRKHLALFLEKTELVPFVNVGAAKVCPLVVTNSPFFAGYDAGGIPIIDMLILSGYFELGYLGKNGYHDSRGKLIASSKVYFYQTEQEAINNHEAYLRNPPQIEVFDPFVTLDDVKYIIPGNPERTMLIQTYQLHIPYGASRAEIDGHRRLVSGPIFSGPVVPKR